MTLVDTSSWIHCLRRAGKADVKARVRALLESGEAVVCPVVLVELWMGAGSDKDRADVRALSSLVAPLEIDARVWARAAKLAQLCCAKGTPVPASDAIIAACAFVHGAKLEAADHHFAVLESFR